MKNLRIKEIVETISETHPFDKEQLIAINTSDVENGVFCGGVYTNISDLKGQFKKTIQKDDILFSEIRPANRRFARVEMEDCHDYVVSTKLMVLRKYNDEVDLDYFYYCLTNQYFLNILQERAENRICSFPQITFDLLAEYSFPMPELKEQKAIARTISLIDKKVSINKSINQNLEATMKQLYDYWFVQFDFPNEEGKPYKSSGGKMTWSDKMKREIPEGWDVVDASDFANIKRGQIITAKDATIGNVKVVAAGITYSYLNGESNRPKNTITVSGSGANAGYINFWREPIFASDCTTVNCGTEVDTLLCLYGLRLFQNKLFDLAIGAAQPHVYPAHVASIPILVIPQNLKDKISSIFCNSNERTANNLAEIETLSKQRDELLPLLMNGQATVNSDLSNSIND